MIIISILFEIGQNRLSTGLVFLLLLLLPSHSFGTSFTARVIKVVEGDRITVLHSGAVTTLHLSEIDCPENDQAFSRKAMAFTATLVLERVVTVRLKETNAGKHLVGEVLMPNGRSLNRELLNAGLAWWDWKNSTDMTLGEIEQIARKKRIGLWSANNPIPPWKFRMISSWESRKKSRILR